MFNQCLMGHITLCDRHTRYDGKRVETSLGFSGLAYHSVSSVSGEVSLYCDAVYAVGLQGMTDRRVKTIARVPRYSPHPRNL